MTKITELFLQVVILVLSPWEIGTEQQLVLYVFLLRNDSWLPEPNSKPILIASIVKCALSVSQARLVNLNTF